MGETKFVSFAIDGEFATQTARNKLFEEYDLIKAIHMVRDCTLNNVLTFDEHTMLCLQILNGDAWIRGISGRPDYGVSTRDDLEETPTDLGKIAKFIKDIGDKLNTLKAKNENYAQRLAFIGEHIGERELKRLNILYKEEEGRSLFPNHPRLKETLLSAVIEKMKKDEKLGSCGYGWLEPDGTWHEVEWGKHGEWAHDWLEKHMPKSQFPDIYTYMLPDGAVKGIIDGDVLTYSLGWVLMDNPAQGEACMRKSPDKKLTKKQKEFLYDYYMERDRTFEAQALYKD